MMAGFRRTLDEWAYAAGYNESQMKQAAARMFDGLLAETLAGKVLVPATGRFVVNDGVVYRIQDMWIEQQASDQQRLGVVIWKRRR